MSIKQKLILGTVGALVTASVLWFLRSPGRSSATPAPSGDSRAASAIAAQRGAGSVSRHASGTSTEHLASSRPRVRPMLRVASLPTRFDSTRLNPAYTSQLAEMAKTSPNTRNYIDYKLGFLARVRECLGGDANASGEVQIMLHFVVAEDGASARGTQMEITDSTVPEDTDRRLRKCADELHRDQVIGITPPRPAGRRDYYWGTKFDLPTTTDGVYAWFQ